MQISFEGKLGILLGLLGLAGAGAIMIAPNQLWIGWSLIGLAAAGGVWLGCHHFGRTFAGVPVMACVLWWDYWYYTRVLSPVVDPNPIQVAPIQTAPTATSPSPTATAKPRLMTTYQKMVILCDKPKPQKAESKKERQEKLDQYADLMKKVFGLTVKAKSTEDEITLDITPAQPVGEPGAQVVKQAWLVKRSADQLFVTITNDYVGALSFILELARPEATDETIKVVVAQVEKFIGAEPGKCKPI